MKTFNQIPFLGIVAQDGYIESYDYDVASENDFHHSYCLSSQGIRYYRTEGTLRFVRYDNDPCYTLEGTPALSPFEQGFRQIQWFAKHCLQQGADPSTPIEVLDHGLGTPYEGKSLGTLQDWASSV